MTGRVIDDADARRVIDDSKGIIDYSRSAFDNSTSVIVDSRVMPKLVESFMIFMSDACTINVL
jgi:hypothetical protein